MTEYVRYLLRVSQTQSREFHGACLAAGTANSVQPVMCVGSRSNCPTALIVSLSPLERFTELYSEVLRGRTKRAKTLYSILVQTMENGIMDHFEQFTQEDNLDAKFIQLSKIINECAVDKNVKSWRPTGDVLEQIRSFDVQEKLKRKKQLEVFVEEEEAEVQQLQLEVTAKRQKMEILQDNALKIESKLLSQYDDTKKVSDELDMHLDKLFNLTWNNVLLGV